MRLPYRLERAHLVPRGTPPGVDAAAILTVELLGESNPPYVWELRIQEGIGQRRKAVRRYDSEAEARQALQVIYDLFGAQGVWRVKTEEPPAGSGEAWAGW